jgi:NADPH2:quinone reductase
MMRAWLLSEMGGLDKLTLGQIADPVAGAGHVVLDVHYAGLNPADRYLAEGQYPARPKFPHILGRDGVGTVTQVGEGASGWRAGDVGVLLRSEVGVNRPGTFAERVAVPVESLTRVPGGWTEQQAAGAPLVYLTAYQALTQFGELPPSNVLVTGASGGVGVASIQLGRAMGHRVIGLSRGTAKRRALLDLGATAVPDPTDPTWRKQLKEILQGARIDLAIDNICGPLLPDVIETLGQNGKVAVVGRLAGQVPQFNTATLFFRRITIKGVHVGAYTPPEAQAAWSAVLALLAKTGARPVVDSQFPLEKLRDAFDRLAQGPLGKVLLAVHPRENT